MLSIKSHSICILLQLVNLFNIVSIRLTHQVMKQSVSNVIIKKEDTKGCSSLSSEEDHQTEDAVSDLETSSVIKTGEKDMVVMSRSDAECAGSSSATTAAASASIKLNNSSNISPEKKYSENCPSTNDSYLSEVDRNEVKNAVELTRNDMNNVSMEQKPSDMQTDLESSAYECIGIIDSRKSTSCKYLCLYFS